MDEFEPLHYINKSGRDIAFIYKGTKYIVKCWRKIELPPDLYDFIESGKIDIELDYEYYINKG